MKPAGRFRSLDSLRGLAAMTVVLYHIFHSLPNDFQDDSYYLSLILFPGSRFAVMLFFVLSGFVLSLPYCSGKNLPYRSYLTRRFFRLYPPYAFAVLVAALLCALVGGRPIFVGSTWLNIFWIFPVTKEVVATHLSMIGVHLASSTRLDGAIWSLIIEMRISILFPLLVWYVKRFGWLGVFVALIASFFCIQLTVALGEVSPFVAESYMGAFLLTGRYASLFLLGVAAAMHMDQMKAVMARASLKIHAVAFIVAAIIWTLIYDQKIVGSLFADTFYGMIAMYLIILCLASPKFSGALSNLVCLWLGDISYSLYLIHLPVMLAVYYLLDIHAPLAVIVAVALPLIMLAGHAMYYLVERPSMALGRRLTRRG